MELVEFAAKYKNGMILLLKNGPHILSPKFICTFSINIFSAPHSHKDWHFCKLNLLCQHSTISKRALVSADIWPLYGGWKLNVFVQNKNFHYYPLSYLDMPIPIIKGWIEKRGEKTLDSLPQCIFVKSQRDEYQIKAQTEYIHCVERRVAFNGLKNCLKLHWSMK